MPLQRDVGIIRGVLPPGFYETSGFSVPVGNTRVSLWMERNDWTQRGRPGDTNEQRTVVRGSALYSSDRGVTWHHILSTTGWGGIETHKAPDGVTDIPFTHTALIAPLPILLFGQLVVKGILEVRQTITVQLAIETF